MIESVIHAIVSTRIKMPVEHSMLAGISGIDASGKGYTAQLLNKALTERGFRVALINADGWLNLPHVRFDTADLAGNFYRYALRLDEMFDRLVLPLRDRSIILEAELAKETADQYHKYKYNFDDIDIILLEGIFLFKREYAEYFDLKIWIDCPFETALARAIQRSQEGLSKAETIQAYETIYFPAQMIHFTVDDPQGSADLVFVNH